MNQSNSSYASESIAAFRWLTSPAVVVFFAWVIALIVFAIASGLGKDFAYFSMMVSMEGLIDDSTIYSYLWLGVAFFSFWAGTFYSRITGQSTMPNTAFVSFDIDRSFKALLIGFFFTASIAALWVGGAIIQFGGITNLANLAASDNTQARDLLISASFPGGRLISSGFIGLTVFSATLLTLGTQIPANKKRIVITIFIFSIFYLGIIPILVSGRVNFFVALIGAYVAASYSARRIIGVQYVLIGGFFLAAVWTAKQYFTLGHVAEEFSAAEQGFEGMLFYFYNDVLNTLNTIGNFDGHYTYGWYSTRFVFFFTFTDQKFLEFIHEARAYIGQYVTAGEVPMLGAPFVDFGFFGIFFLFVLGYLTQRCHNLSSLAAGYIPIYGLIFSCLLLSTHASFITSQEVVYSIILVFILAKASYPAIQVQPEKNWAYRVNREI